MLEVKTIDINGETWEILIVSYDNEALYRSDGSHTIGTCDNRYKTIYIMEGLSEYRTKKVLCHELTHACLFSYDIDLTLEQEELLADLMATYGEEIVDTTNNIFRRIKKYRESQK